MLLCSLCMSEREGRTWRVQSLSRRPAAGLCALPLSYFALTLPFLTTPSVRAW